jgi:membrane complex biogenesis BtpA family protein
MRIQVQAAKDDALLAVFGRQKVIIGTVHLQPLPGSPAYRGQAFSSIMQAALEDASAYRSGGADGIIVENSGDVPFAKPDDIGPETVAYMTAVTAAICEATGIPVGVNCLANAVVPAIAVASAAGARFVRSNQWVNAYVANEGFVEGAAARATRFRTAIGAHEVRVFADVHVKHGSHSIVADRPVPEQARDAEFFDADVLIATGTRTGHATSPAEVQALRAGSSLPVMIGSGLDVENIAQLFAVADGAIVGSSLKRDGAWWNPVERERVEALVRIADRIRDAH